LNTVGKVVDVHTVEEI